MKQMMMTAKCESSLFFVKAKWQNTQSKYWQIALDNKGEIGR